MGLGLGCLPPTSLACLSLGRVMEEVEVEMEVEVEVEVEAGINKRHFTCKN